MDEGGQGAHMIPSRSRLVELASVLLAEDDREAVVGDFEESGASSIRGFVDIVGLVGRRQLQAWGDWRAWLGLFVVIAVGLLLGVVSRFLAEAVSSAIHLYVTEWQTGDVIRGPGGLDERVGAAAYAFLGCAALTCWGWTCGAAVTLLSRRTSVVNAALFVASLVAATSGTTTAGYSSVLRFAPWGYSLLIPTALRFSIVTFSFAWALVRIKRRGFLSLRTVTFWSAGTVVLTFLNAGAIRAAVSCGRIPAGRYSFEAARSMGCMGQTVHTTAAIPPWFAAILPWTMLLPLAVVFAKSHGSQRHDNAASSPVV